MKIDGFNDKMLVFLDVLLEKFSNFFDEFSESDFEMAKASLKHDDKTSSEDIQKFCKEIREKILAQDSWMKVERRQEFDRISSKDAKTFMAEFLQNIKIHVLIQGNFIKSHADEVVATIEKHFKFEPIDYVS